MKLPDPTPARPRRRLHRTGRYAAWTAGVLLLLLAALAVAARLYWPTVASRKVDLEALLTQAVQQDVRLGRIEAYWDGLNPGVRVSGATVHSADGTTPSVRVAEVQATLALLPLLWGRVELGQLVLHRPTLTLVRALDGVIDIEGVPRPPATAASGGGAWLLQQPRVVVRGGAIRWRDAREPGKTLPIADLDVVLRNSGDRHRLAASAQLPARMCRQCSMSLDVTGNPLAGAWHGEIALRAQGFDVTELPLALRERLPPDARGRFDVRLWSDWRDGRPRLVRGEAAVSGFRLPLGAQRRPLAFRELAAEVAWRATDGGWRLDLADLNVALTGRAWAAGRVRVAKSGGGGALEVERVQLDDLSAFVAAHQAEHPLLRRWAPLRPSGALENLQMSVRGPWEAPTAFRVSGRLIDVGLVAHEQVPGVRGLNGSLAFDADRGTLDFDGGNFVLDMPRVFRGPLQARRAAGSLHWEKTETAWRVSGRDLRVRSDDGSGTGSLTLQIPHDRAASPVLMLRVDFRDGNGAQAARYYPVRRLSPQVLEWMESAFLGGHIVSGHLIYEGPTRAFPFQEGQGRFEIRGHVRGGVYRYLRGWTPLTQAEADVAIDGTNVRITGRGRIGALQARDVRVEVGSADGAAERTVRVQGTVEGPVAETLRVLQAIERSRASAWRRYAGEIASAAGSGALDLEVRVPLGAERTPAFDATYRFQDAALRLDNGTGLEAASGSVRFTEAGLGASSLRGTLFGGPVTVAAAGAGAGWRIEAAGNLLPAQLLRTRPALAQQVSGGMDWSLTWQQQASGPQLRLEADVSRIRSRLPAPLSTADMAAFGKLTVATEQNRPEHLVLALSGGQALSGKVALMRAPSGWRVQKGRVDVGRGTAPLPQHDSFEVGLRMDALDVDRWLPLWGGGTQRTGPELPVAAELPLALTADIKRLDLGNRHWGRVFAHVVRRGAEWRTVVDGDALAGEGTLTFAPKTPPHIRLALAYLRLPERTDAEQPDSAQPDAGKESMDPRRLPALDVHALSLEYKNRKYGELNLNAAPYQQGWRIERFRLKRPEMQLAVNGVWRVTNEREATDLTLQFDSDDMGATLDAFGATGQMADGKVKVRTTLAWPGAPMRPTLAGLDGNVEVSAEKGRFLKFDPGAARLFGLLDLRSIGRYLTLDFSPAFGKGFAFDAVHGSIKLERGNAYTSDFLVRGPSLSLRANGRIGLAAEDYDLVLEASPKFGNTLTFTSWGLLGPQAAAAVLALQRLFRRQIEAGTRVTYTVKGPWDSPKVTKVGKPAAAEDPPPGS